MVTLPTSYFRDLYHRIAKAIKSLRVGGKPRRWVGLDLGSASIKAAEIEDTRTGPRLIRIAVKELPASPESPASNRAQCVREVLEEFDAREIHMAVSGPDVAVRRVQLPSMSARELPVAVRWQVKDQVPFPTEDAIVDFRSIGEIRDGDLKKQDLLVGVASRPFIRDVVAIVEESGVRVASVSPTPLAVWHSAEAQLGKFAREGSVALVEMGAGTTEVAIIKDGNLRMVRELPIGSENITAALVGETVSDEGMVSIDREQAESIKRRYGVLTEDASGATEEGVPFGHLILLMHPVLENLLTDVSRFLDFYRVEMEEGQVSRLLLCGGGASLKSLQPYLADRLGVTVEILNPLASITERVQPLAAEEIAEAGPRLAAAIGLALDHGQSLNLLPPKARRASRLEISPNVWLVTARAAAGVALALYVALQAGVMIFQRQVHAQEAEWARWEPSYTRYVAAQSDRKQLEAKISLLERLLDQPPVWDGILKELSLLAPPAIELDELIVMTGRNAAGPPQRKIYLKGRVASGGPSQDKGLGLLLDAMNKSVFFTAVELTSSEIHSANPAKSRFEIEGLLR